MSTDLDRKRLSQAKRLEWLQRDLKMTEMVSVYLADKNDLYDYLIYGVLISSDQIEQTLSDPGWNLLFNFNVPIKRLVLNRNFHEMRDGYKEISEEFRLFHNLYHDRKTDKYIKIDEAGNEDVVAIIEANRVQIRLQEIRQFLASKEMYLSFQFDCREHSKYSLEELGLKEGWSDQRDDLICWGHSYGDFGDAGGLDDLRAFSLLTGKRLIKPLPKSKSGLRGFAEKRSKEKHVEFIIGIDENGDEIIHTSDPDTLANFFGANLGAPRYLTPVHFRKQVLDKYYQQPSKYTVEDSLLRCGSLWYMQIDTHHDDKVCAWLGDLGRDLPYTEQLYWRSYNIPPPGGVSKTYFKRQLMVEAMRSDRPEHLFKERYQNLQDACKEYLGWQLLLPLDTADEYHFKNLRVPATDEQRDFDELVLSLTKILIDSLNERRLNKLIPEDQKAKLKGSIARLEAVLSTHDVEGAAERIVFLRKLQSLRSSSAAHRKGRNYRKIAKHFGVESQHLRDVFTGIIWQALDVLDYFIFLVRSSPINPEIIEKNKIEEGYAILDGMVGFAKSDRTDGSVNHDDA